MKRASVFLITDLRRNTPKALASYNKIRTERCDQASFFAMDALDVDVPSYCLSALKDTDEVPAFIFFCDESPKFILTGLPKDDALNEALDKLLELCR